MTDATTGQGADGARRGEKTAGDGPAGRAYVTGGQSNAPQGDRSKGSQGQESAPLVAGHDTRDTSAAERTDTGDGSRSPLVAGPAGHEAAAKDHDTATRAAKGDGSPRGRLLPHDECDKLSLRLQHAVAGFVDGPRNAVEEADHVMEEVASRVTDALTQRRRTLRTSWQDGEDKHANAGDTEQLRLALRDYRELADRLLHL
ncbi:hypothetical protein [Streptomyces sp. WM6386]|uniref:hypothetical protein n=1 Tax=Streptomyces sp. WM6386 TaxID=1415558 RepID=UPI00061971F5|nr:hypothetical protein [Streptomyces sp. WM6386]KKD02860.1 hypothetical protein TN53_38150 [Streptomyces sp. WM6386]